MGVNDKANFIQGKSHSINLETDNNLSRRQNSKKLIQDDYFNEDGVDMVHDEGIEVHLSKILARKEVGTVVGAKNFSKEIANENLILRIPWGSIHQFLILIQLLIWNWE